MKGSTPPLWPIRYKPLPDELLSCWLVRLAHGHGLKVQTFCNLIFGNRRQVWNRDIDRLAPAWLIDELCRRTGTSVETALNTTLRAYEGVLYQKFRMAGPLHWILVLQMYHRTRQGFGLQYCQACLASDPIPYFRKSWRVAFNTVCTRHGTMLFDRCPACAKAIAAHRIDMAKSIGVEDFLLSHCHACGFDLREAQPVRGLSFDARASSLLIEANDALANHIALGNGWDWGQYAVMRHLCKLMTTRSRHVRLRDFILAELGADDMMLTSGHISFEMRSIHERHFLLQLTAWLMVDLEARLAAAWRARVVRYNVLFKDFSGCPDWYVGITQKFSNWRSRGM
jgi:hypothetical protein